MEPPEGEWLPVAEGARRLGVTPASLRMAVKRGRLSVHKVHNRLNLVSAQELERYRREHLGKKGWQHRHTPHYEPSPRALRQRHYLERKRAQQAAAQAAQEDGAMKEVQ